MTLHYTYFVVMVDKIYHTVEIQKVIYNLINIPHIERVKN
jgi:hypothetical protein